ncbi:RelE family toxin-antitoxin system [Klebsiella pneumoniae]|nr:RelE family toxin-antitoxin system [Klebsiella pneumoniae]
MTDITELAQSLKRRATSANEFGESLYVKADDVLALVEALASEKRICATWRKTAEANSEKLEKAQQSIDSQREYYEGVIADGGNRIAELESCVSNLKVNRPVVYGDGFHEGYWKARSEQSMSSEDENHG